MPPEANQENKRKLRILHLEDNSLDAELLRQTLAAEKIDCEIQRVVTRINFMAALAQEQYDLILSDFSLPTFDGVSALEIAQECSPETPFIFVSGTIGEEQAVESLRSGAVDYVIKDRMQRLGTAVRRALRDRADRVERQRVLDELRQRDELFRQITDNVDDLISVLDTEGRRVFNSPSYGKLVADPQALQGTDSFADVHPDDRGRVRRVFELTLSTGKGQRAEYRFVLKDGSVRQIESQGSAIRDKDGKVTHVVVVSRDVSERGKAEAKIREQAALLDQASDAILVCDLELHITYWNRRAERLYGWTAAEALGKDATNLISEGEPAGPQEALRNLIRRGEWQGEVPQSAKGGHKLMVESRWTLMRDEKGEPASILMINTDVTEKRRLEAEHLRNQRVQSIGALAGGIAHDLKNALTPVLIGVDILREERLSENATEMLDLMVRSVRRGSEMINQILSFSRGVGGQQAAVDIRGLAEEMLQLAQKTFPHAIEIRNGLPEGLHRIKGNPTQLHQVLLNLCVNARDAMPEGGILTVEAENVVLQQAALPPGRGLSAGEYVLIKVSDTGHGIAPDQLNKIFEPFFTTKELGKGTGLGLSTVLGIVKTHGGFVDVASGVGKGTTFKVYLPASDA